MTEKILAMEPLPPQLELMLALAQGRIPDALPQGLDWGSFQNLVEKNRVTPLIAHSLGRLPRELLAERPELQAIRNTKNSYALICMEQIRVLASLTGAFREKGLRVISMKGPILAMELYGDPSMRYSRDLDLLVPREEFDAACAVLEEQGFQPEITVWNKTPLRRRLLEKRGEEMHLSFSRGDICVELHWRLSFRVEESFDALWKNRQEKPLMGLPVPCLGREDELPYLIAHAAGHGYQRLRWLLDIHCLQQKDPRFFENAYRLMAKQGTGMLLLETMLVMYRLGLAAGDCENELFCLKREGDTLRFSWADACGGDARRALELTQAVWPMLFLEEDARGMAGRNYERLLPTLGRKRTVLDVLRPCGADLELIDLPDRWYFLYYLIRPLHKLWRLIQGKSNDSSL